MISDLQVLLAVVAAVGSGLIAGTFFAFSAFVMRALERLPTPHGVAAMQSINVVVINPVFLSTFFGTGLVCAVLCVGVVLGWHETRPIWHCRQPRLSPVLPARDDDAQRADE